LQRECHYGTIACMGRHGPNDKVEPNPLAASGSRARVLADLARYMASPDAPMVSDGFARTLKETRNMNVSVNKMYEDDGYKLNVIQYLASRGAGRPFPRTPLELIDSLQDFFTFCGLHKVPPTISCFSVWNGVSVPYVNQIEQDKSDPRSSIISACKEAIRGFLELSAMDGSLNFTIYLHQNKVYYGAVENQSVTFKVEDNTSDLTPDEYKERVLMLQSDEYEVTDVDPESVCEQVEHDDRDCDASAER